MKILTGTKVESITDSGAEGTVVVSKDGKTEEFKADKVLQAIGFAPNVSGYGLEAAGVALTERGAIGIDEQMQTSMPHIFAIGDVTGKLMLAHVAEAQGVVAAEVIGKAETMTLGDYRMMPRATFCQPQVASFGLTEEQAQAEGYDVVVAKFPFTANGKAHGLADPTGFVKLIADKKHLELIGGHLIGPDVSELLPHFSKIVDDVTLIRSMHTGVNNHGQSIYALINGTALAGRTTLGSWLTYGLGSENQNLPAYVALTDPRGLPVLGVDNFSNGWLPSLYQATVIRPKEPRILNLEPPMSLQGEAQERYLDYVQRLNKEHAAARPGETDLEARIQSFELAARMQSAAKDALNIDEESEATKRLYGLDNPACKEFGSRCLIARRLVERGVRCVSLFTGNQTWDHHSGIATSLPAACLYVDQPAAALVMDLKQRGLLDSTVVHWGGEMGRLPVIQNRAGGKNDRAKVGRDHNTYGFGMWVAGGGFKAGHIHGATDEFGHHAVENVVNHFDYHATLMHLFGIDANKLSFKRNGTDMRLVENPDARIVHELLA